MILLFKKRHTAFPLSVAFGDSSPSGRAKGLCPFCENKQSIKMTLISLILAIPWRESKGNRARFLFGGSRVGFQKGRGKRNPRPFCDSLHTFCSHRKYARGATGSATLRKTVSQTLQCPVHGAPPHLPHQNHKTCFRAKQKQVCCFHFTGFISSIFSIVNTVRKRE